MRPKFNFAAASKKQVSVNDSNSNDMILNPNENLLLNVNDTDVLATDNISIETSINLQHMNECSLNNESLNSPSFEQNNGEECKLPHKSAVRSSEPLFCDKLQVGHQSPILNISICEEVAAINTCNTYVTDEEIAEKVVEKVALKKRFNIKNAVIKPKTSILTSLSGEIIHDTRETVSIETSSLSTTDKLAISIEDQPLPLTTEKLSTPVVTQKCVLTPKDPMLTSTNDSIEISITDETNTIGGELNIKKSKETVSQKVDPIESLQTDRIVTKRGKFNVKNAINKTISKLILLPDVSLQENIITQNETVSVLIDRGMETQADVDKCAEETCKENEVADIGTLKTAEPTHNDNLKALLETPVKKSLPHKFNCKNAVFKENIKSPQKNIIASSSKDRESDMVTTHKLNVHADDVRSVSSMSSSRRAKEKPFVVKNLAMVPHDDSLDISTLSLKAMLNISAIEPPPKSRNVVMQNKKNTKRIANTSCESICPSVNDNDEDHCDFRLDTDGNIVKNVVQKNRKGFQTDGEIEVVIEDAAYFSTTYRSHIKRKLSGKRWTITETSNFYKALSIVGTNFQAMESIFEGRTRNDLKRKYQVEEKAQPDKINYTLTNTRHCDITNLKFDSHIPKVKSRCDAVKRVLRGPSDSDSDGGGSVRAPKKKKRRKFSLDAAENGLALSVGDWPGVLD